MTKRTAIYILGVAVILGIIAFAIFAQTPVWLSTSSPNKTYTVELRGNKSRPRIPLIEHQTRFTLLKNGQATIKNAFVDSYDWFDSAFENSYPQHIWVNDSVLRFGLNVAESEKSPDSLAISNDAGKPIKYLIITALDMVFVFDMPPKSNIKLPVPHERWLSWITCEGEFNDGQQISWKGVNFFHQDQIREPLRYCITINEESLKIGSPVMDGYNGDGTGDTPNIPKTVNCER